MGYVIETRTGNGVTRKYYEGDWREQADKHIHEAYTDYTNAPTWDELPVMTDFTHRRYNNGPTKKELDDIESEENQ